MAAEEVNGTSQTSIKATYTEPGDSHTFTQPVTSPQAADTKSKAAYMGALRSSVKSLQSDINVFLTAKMEQDKHKATTTSSNGTKSKSRDEEEEENYGEEKVEDD